MEKPLEKRRAVPLEIRLQVALRQLTEAWRASGRLQPGETLELDHIPALIRRAHDKRTGCHIPHQHDPDALAYKTRWEHKLKTHGNGATNRGSDRGEHAKTKRLEMKRREQEVADARRAMLATSNSDELPEELLDKASNRRDAKPKRRLQSANRWPAKKPKTPYVRRGV
jgi:hypothetical protein